MNKLLKIIKVCVDSDKRVNKINKEWAIGKITTSECIDKIVEETKIVKELIEDIKHEDFINDRKVEAYEYN